MVSFVLTETYPHLLFEVVDGQPIHRIRLLWCTYYFDVEHCRTLGRYVALASIDDPTSLNVHL
jgi:hypothetical protein